MLDYELIISDVDGVILREGEPIWENIQAIKKMHEEGKKVVLVTNNSGFSRVLLSRQLNYLGIKVNPNDIITSGLSAALYMKRKTDISSVYVIGEEGLVEEMKNFEFEILSSTEIKDKVPDAVVLGLDRLVTYDKLSTGVSCIAKGAKFIVTNMDRLWPSKDGLKPGAGAIASSIIYALNKQPDFVAGKPNRWIVEVAMEISNIKDLSRVVVIGDQLETDIKMGNEIGADTILVLTGIAKREDVEKSGIKPKIIVDNLASLV